MAQHDMNLANQSGAAYRADHNDNIEALVTQSEGPADPPAIFPSMRVADTGLGIVKRRDPGNSVWLPDGPLASSLTRTITVDGPITQADHDVTILADASSGPLTITLDALANFLVGTRIRIKRIDATANAVTIDPTGAETIDGVAAIYLGAQFDAVTMIAAAAGWYLEAGVDPVGVGALSSGATVNWNLGLYPSAELTLDQSPTLAAPTNIQPGQTYELALVQDATGGHSITYDPIFKWPGGIPQQPDATANAESLMSVWARSATALWAGINQGFA